jgi:hypothetical protein
MDIIHLLIVLVVVGAALYLLQLIPMDATVKRVIQVIAIVLIVIWAIRTLLPVALG